MHWNPQKSIKNIVKQSHILLCCLIDWFKLIACWKFHPSWFTKLPSCSISDSSSTTPTPSSSLSRTIITVDSPQAVPSATMRSFRKYDHFPVFPRSRPDTRKEIKIGKTRANTRSFLWPTFHRHATIVLPATSWSKPQHRRRRNRFQRRCFGSLALTIRNSRWSRRYKLTKI